ncbi:primosomal protein DnaI [Fundicoccus culcitae]|uniref:Primosomal protein DnaI n=1 Tax=Fundicoccus culcitae TaxID=2969821 RepID=A0ABY5PAG6_9LACT|nr:primosomal protein DnaI [Fundicoccus culcitae]UUX35540.1 primosomal protein DnaI [Fundicoccus culcitae]
MNEIIEKMIKANPRYQESLNQTIRKTLNYEPIQAFVMANKDQISEEMISKSLSKLNEFKLESEALNRGEQGQNPGFRPQLFINEGYIDVTYVPTQDYYEQQNNRRKASLLDNRMMSRDVRNASLADFDTENSPSRQILLEAVMNFIDVYFTNPKQAQGLFIVGPFGVGKTFLLGALANYLVSRNVAVTMIHYPTFASDIKASISNNTTHEILQRVKSVDVLMIDDIGAESNSVWLRDEVLSVILEYRMKESLATFFTSNGSISNLESHLTQSRESIEPLKAKRLMERINFLAKEYTLSGENRRQFSRN